MTRRKNSPQKNPQEAVTAQELMKTDISNITEHEYRMTIIKLIAGLEKSLEECKGSRAAEFKDLKNGQEELKKKLEEIQGKLEAATARIEEVLGDAAGVKAPFCSGVYHFNVRRWAKTKYTIECQMDRESGGLFWEGTTSNGY